MPLTLPQELASCLYRVAQEGYEECVEACPVPLRIDVRLIGVDGGLILSIQDNGKGFEVMKESEIRQCMGWGS